MNAKNTKILGIIKKAGEIMRAAKMSDGLIHSKAGTFNFVTEKFVVVVRNNHVNST